MEQLENAVKEAQKAYGDLVKEIGDLAEEISTYRDLYNMCAQDLKAQKEVNQQLRAEIVTLEAELATARDRVLALELWHTQ